MSHPHAIVVTSSTRGDYILEDLRSSLQWSCAPTATIVAQEQPSDLGQTAEGFFRGQLLAQAVEKHEPWQFAVLLSDNCLVLSPGLDRYFAEPIQRDGVGLIGVGLGHRYVREWQEAQTWLFSQGLRTADRETPPASLSDDILILSGRFVGQLLQSGLLDERHRASWPGTYGCYLSWICWLMGFHVVQWGCDVKPLPPLYATTSPRNGLTPPQLLRSDFLIYSPAGRVLSYSESELREIYKQQRGEPSRPLPAHKPVIEPR